MDVALKECLKAFHKRTDAYHIFLVPGLYSPLVWAFYRLSNFIFQLAPGSPHWCANMHKPLFIGISLPLARVQPWSLRRMAVLVEMEREMHKV
jgi:hypothetical protein